MCDFHCIDFHETERLNDMIGAFLYRTLTKSTDK
jgi:hypothetical protein